MTVTDGAGLSAVTTAPVHVDPDHAPIAALIVNPASGVAPLTVTADASGSTDNDGTPIASYEFDFGDGTILGPSVSATAGHTYAAAGTYTVVVTIVATAGMSSATSATVIVS